MTGDAVLGLVLEESVDVDTEADLARAVSSHAALDREASFVELDRAWNRTLAWVPLLLARGARGAGADSEHVGNIVTKDGEGRVVQMQTGTDVTSVLDEIATAASGHKAVSSWDAPAFSESFDVAEAFRHTPNLGTCAIVGSGGKLKGAGLGGAIDAHTSVVRFNTAPVEGYESDVGAKTTVRFWSFGVGLNATAIARESDSTLVLYPVDLLPDYEALLELLRRKDDGAPPFDYSRLYALPPRFLNYLYVEQLNNTHSSMCVPSTLNESKLAVLPSTGLVAVVWALHACAAVDVYGFGMEAPPKPMWYYDRFEDCAPSALWPNRTRNYCRKMYTAIDEGRAAMKKYHDWDYERAFLDSLARAGLVTRY